jgi:uncharacterized protein (DUF362 family)
MNNGIAPDYCVGMHACGHECYSDDSQMRAALLTLCHSLGWASGTSPFASVVPAGANVLVKPNWVLHRNQGVGGFEPLVTHGSLVRSVVDCLCETAAAKVTLGDAPVQGCDFGELLSASGIDQWATRLRESNSRFRGPIDFRRTVSAVDDGIRRANENVRSESNYVLFDIGAESYLEPVTDQQKSFRVTMYPPKLMAETHGPGRHRYLVAKEVLEATIIVNLPKLKTHKKAGVTCALKNLVGINGNKEYLPHHRFGGSQDGGDCYPGSSPVKRLLEQALDLQNSATAASTQKALGLVVRGLQSATHHLGDEFGVEGSWSGNDTVWRMCLDLNRIAIYGRADGTIADTPQRQLLHLVDAVVGGQGDGPLAPDPLPINLLLASRSASAIDWLGAHLLGYDPARIPIAAQSFKPSRWPLTSFSNEDIRLISTSQPDWKHVHQIDTYKVNYPAGWRDAALA